MQPLQDYRVSFACRWRRKLEPPLRFRELAGNGRSTDMQMINSTHVKTHRSAAGGKGRSKSRLLAARAEGADVDPTQYADAARRDYAHRSGRDGCPGRRLWPRWCGSWERERIWRWPHGSRIRGTITERRPLYAATGLQSIEFIHFARVTRDARLAGKPGIDIWQQLKTILSCSAASVMGEELGHRRTQFEGGYRGPTPRGYSSWE